MKKCSECNIEMIDNCTIEGQHPFEVGADGRTDISIHIPTNKKINFLGLELDNKEEKELKARVCPKCGKVEFYIDPKEKRLINL